MNRGDRVRDNRRNRKENLGTVLGITSDFMIVVSWDKDLESVKPTEVNANGRTVETL